MEDISVQANASFAELVDLAKVRHLVDVGGGNGANIIQLARKYPSLRASVFDSPTVCEIARANIRAAGFADRLDAVPGNCFPDPFPKGADCLLFCHFFTIWTEEKDRFLFKKAYDALPSGGTVMIFNMMQSDNEDGPWAAAMGSPYFLTLATGEGMLYTWSEYESWMREVGFTNVQRQSLPREHGVIRGTKP
jgi:cyclopropane fatty-acyl-phospholipid synthase-like methyltransferase